MLPTEGRRSRGPVDRVDAAMLDPASPLFGEDRPPVEHLIMPHMTGIFALGENQPPFIARVADAANGIHEPIDRGELLEA